MMFKVPRYAKQEAMKALDTRKNLPVSKRFGIDRDRANRLGINSGVERARQLVRSDTIPEADARRVAAFYSRFKNCHTPKCEGAIALWGGRRYGQVLVKKLR